MTNGFMEDKELRCCLERMCEVAELMAVSVPFTIEDLFSPSEWRDITLYGHITLGQMFKSRVETGSVKNVHVYGNHHPAKYVRK